MIENFSIEKDFNPEYLIVPRLAMKLPSADRMVFGAVYAFCQLSKKKCTASNVCIGRISCVSSGGVANSLNRLEETGLIKRFYKDEQKKNRDYIISMWGFGKLDSSDSVHSIHPQMIRDSSTKEQIKNKIKNINNSNSEQVKPVHESIFSFEGYLKQVMDNSFIVIDDIKRLTNPARYFAAYYLKRKGLKFNSKEAVEGAMKRHYKAAKELGQFTSDMKRISRAFDEAENLVVNNQRVPWTLETVLKQLTK